MLFPTRVGRVAVGLWLAACASRESQGEPVAVPAPVGTDAGPRPYVQPRLAIVHAGQVPTSFDANGYPLAMSGSSWHFDLAWSGPQLREVKAYYQGNNNDIPDRTIVASFQYEGERVVRMAGGTRTDVLSYNADGSLARWLQGTRLTREYRYTGGRLSEVTTSSVLPDGSVVPWTEQITYDDSGCPTSSAGGHGTTGGGGFRYTYDAGRLASYSSSDGNSISQVLYDSEGRIASLAGIGPLQYQPGEARGLDLQPGLFHGGWQSGYPAHGELFRLDGRCEPSLRSQSLIHTLLVTSLSWP